MENFTITEDNLKIYKVGKYLIEHDEDTALSLVRTAGMPEDHFLYLAFLDSSKYLWICSTPKGKPFTLFSDLTKELKDAILSLYPDRANKEI